MSHGQGNSDTYLNCHLECNLTHTLEENLTIKSEFKMPVFFDFVAPYPRTESVETLIVGHGGKDPAIPALCG